MACAAPIYLCYVGKLLPNGGGGFVVRQVKEVKVEPL